MSKVVLINGPSGAGKTAVAKAILDHVKGEWAYIGQDDMHSLIKSGYRSANDLAETWDNDVKRQWELSVALSCDSIKRCAEYSVNCVVDFFAPTDEFKKWEGQLKGYEYTHCILLPSLAITLERNRLRHGRARLGEEKIKANHAPFAREEYGDDVYVLDTSELDVASSVSQIEKYLYK